MSFGSDHKGGGSPTESEDAIRHLKASQSVDAAFQAAGFPSPPGDIAALVTNHVKSAVKGLPISQVANMSPGSGALAAAALAGVDLFVSSLTPTQREAAKAGVNPLDPAAMLKFSAGLGPVGGGTSGGSIGGHRGNAGQSPSSGARYDGVNGASNNSPNSSAYWGSPAGQAQMREFAVKSGLGWAADNPEILRMGPDAIKVLGDVHFEKKSYQELKGIGWQPKHVVNLARFAQKRHIDANDLAHTIHHNNTEIARSPDGSIHQPTMQQLNNIENEYLAHPDAPGAAAKAHKGFQRVREQHQDKSEHIDNLEKALGTASKAELKAKTDADQQAGAADIKSDAAGQKSAKAADNRAALDSDFDSFGSTPSKPAGDKPPAAPIQRASNDPPKDLPKDSKSAEKKPVVEAAATPAAQNKPPEEKKLAAAPPKAIASPSMA